MNILALSDRVDSPIYSPQIRDLYGDIDLVLGCGDLPYYYLEYVLTMLPLRVLFVYGNHDGAQYKADGRRVTSPEGPVSLEDRTTITNGLIIGGLGGSMRYRPHAAHQYTEGEMLRRVIRMAPQLLWNRIAHGRYIDILITHSPPFGIHDAKDLTHTGFKSLLTFMRYFKPRYLLHGHTHLYRRDVTVETRYYQTMVVNVYPKRVIVWDWNDTA